MRSKLLIHLVRLLCFLFLLPLASAVKKSSTSSSSSWTIQTPFQPLSDYRILNFDDIETDHGDGWADLPSPTYGSLRFEGFYVFKPTHPEIKRVMSENDLNCAPSKPNALYGTRFNFGDNPRPPFISTAGSRPDTGSGTGPPGTESSNEAPLLLAPPPVVFELQSLKVKALDMPFAYTKLSLRGHQQISAVHGGISILEWNVDFPAGFHDMFKVDIEAFSGQKWSNLTTLEIWADFHDDENGIVLDWEYCLDDLQVKFDVDRRAG